MPAHSTLPQAFRERMQQQLGDEYPAFEQALITPSETSIRMHPLKGTTVPDGPRVPWCSRGVFLAERPKFPLDPHWHAGVYYVQEASSMILKFVVKQLDLPKNAVVLDACAAPGGKTTHLLSLLDEGSLLVSNEVIPKRNLILRDNIVRWGMPNAVVTQSDIRAVSRLREHFDLAVVDAPCSGEGLFRKDAKAIQEWSPAHVHSCAVRQRGILQDIAKTIRPGGYLLYSTCTYSREENEAQVLELLAQGEWQTCELAPPEDWGIVTAQKELGWRFYPHRTRGEGFFFACLRKTGGTQPPPAITGTASTADSKLLNDWVRLKDLSVVTDNNIVHLFPTQHLKLLEALRHHLHVTQWGTLAGELIRGSLKPSHDLALSVRLKDSVPSYPMSLSEARSYLRKQTLPIRPGLAQGWHVATYDSVPLGWLKVLDRRINNYYPKPLSLRP